MKRLYLLGYPLAHSVSPAMQNAALRAVGLNDWCYEALLLSEIELRQFISRRDGDWEGANVTVPYKERIIPWLDDLTESAREIGAVNTLVHREGKLIGDSTDAEGFARALKTAGVPLRNARVVLFGAGGAARAAAWALEREGVNSIAIVNRTADRAHRLVEWLERMRNGVARLATANAVGEADVVINATSVGMWPKVGDKVFDDESLMRPGTWVMDMVYNPRETRLLEQAKRAGARTVEGLEMLVYQGALSLESWTGRAAPVGVMRVAAQVALNAQFGNEGEEPC